MNKTEEKKLVENFYMYARQDSATANGGIEGMRKLIEKGLEISKRRASTALIHAAISGKLETIRYLVEELGANINTESDRAFVTAASNGDLEIVKYLADNGADIHAQDDQAFKNAAMYGRIDLVKYLVEEKEIDVNVENCAAVENAVINSKIEMVDYLIGKGANIQQYKDKILTYSIMYGGLKLTKFFILQHNFSVVDALKTAGTYEDEQTIEWCIKYIKSKELNDALEVELSKNKDTIKVKRKI